MKACGGPGLTVTARPRLTSTSTEPPVPAVTAKVLGMSAKLAETAASAVTEPTASAQGLASVPDAHASSDGPDSVHLRKR